MSDRAVELTHKLIQRRSDLRTAFGPNYEKQVAPARALLRREMKRTSLGAVEAALRLCKAAIEKHPEIKILPNMLIAAAVDLVEAGDTA